MTVLRKRLSVLERPKRKEDYRNRLVLPANPSLDRQIHASRIGRAAISTLPMVFLNLGLCHVPWKR